MSTFRIAQINETIKSELGMILLQTIEETPLGLITISKVETTPDLRYAVIWVSFLENKDHTQTTDIESRLKKAAGVMRKELSQRLTLKHTPELHFKIDHSADNYNHLEEVLTEMNKGNKKEINIDLLNKL